jgi:cell wall-associated NlpC family hydrolase
MQIYREVYGRGLPRTSAQMWEAGRPVSRSAARPGDLVFFRNRGRHIDHVGIYLGNNRFAHASTSRGVVYDDLTSAYYAQRFAGIRRMM